MHSTVSISKHTLKKGTVRDYTSYELLTKSSGDGRGSPGEYSVERRYRDFVWLHETLRECNSGE